MMRYGIDIAPFDELAEPALLVELAVEAEAAGWDGVFLWDHLVVEEGGRLPIADAWVALSAMAAATSRVRLGPLVAALSRRPPWLVARESATLDRLSGGRLILGVGTGFPPTEFTTFGDDADGRQRAERLDEAIAIIAGLWSGAPFSFEGRHFTVRETTFVPTPVQQPRPPIWVAATNAHRRPLARAARWDGCAPIKLTAEGGPLDLSPEEIATIRAEIEGQRPAGARPYDVLVYGATEAGSAADGERVAACARAGATWWSETINTWRAPVAELRERLRQGPPRSVGA